MSLSASRLADALEAAMLANPAIGATDGPALSGMCTAIAQAIVTEITTHAAVQPGSFAAGGDAVTGAGTVA